MKPQITKLTLSLATILTLGATSIQAENILQNGSFEDFTVLKAKNNWKKVQLTNWDEITKVNSNGKEATDGSVKIVLDSDKSLNLLTQTISTIEGGIYTFSVDAYASKKQLSTAGFEMIVDGEVVETFTPTTEWKIYTVTFEGNGEEQSIGFREITSQNNAKGVFLDNAQLSVKTPETLIDLAQKYGKATQGAVPSYATEHTPQMGIDGDNTSYIYTGNRDDAWYQVELPKNASISKIVVKNSTYRPEHLLGARVYLSNNPYNGDVSEMELVGRLKGKTTEQVFSFDNPKNFSYIVVENYDNLHFTTLSAFGKLVDEPLVDDKEKANIAHLYGEAKAGSEHDYSYTAYNAIDNNPNTFFLSKKDSVTNWLDIKLPKDSKIESVEIDNLPSSLGNLLGAKLYVLDEEYNATSVNLDDHTPVATLSDETNQKIVVNSVGSHVLIKGEGNNALYLKDVKVYNSSKVAPYAGVDLANKYGVATQAIDKGFKDYQPAVNVIDGDINTWNYTNAGYGGWDGDNWVQIQLPRPTTVNKIVVQNGNYNSSEDVKQRIGGADVYLTYSPYYGDGPLPEDSKIIATLKATNDPQIIDINGTKKGAYLLIKGGYTYDKIGRNIHLSRVEVYGTISQAPTFDNADSNVNIDKWQGKTESIYDVNSTDYQGDAISYAIDSDVPFRIDNSGHIYVTSTLDTGVYTLPVVVSDGTHSQTREVRVNVADTPKVKKIFRTNDSNPKLSGYVPNTYNDGDTLTVTIAGVSYEVTVDSDGTWTILDDEIKPELSIGMYDVTLSVNGGEAIVYQNYFEVYGSMFQASTHSLSMETIEDVEVTVASHTVTPLVKDERVRGSSIELKVENGVVTLENKSYRELKSLLGKYQNENGKDVLVKLDFSENILPYSTNVLNTFDHATEMSIVHTAGHFDMELSFGGKDCDANTPTDKVLYCTPTTLNDEVYSEHSGQHTSDLSEQQVYSVAMATYSHIYNSADGLNIMKAWVEGASNYKGLSYDEKGTSLSSEQYFKHVDDKLAYLYENYFRITMPNNHIKFSSMRFIKDAIIAGMGGGSAGNLLGTTSGGYFASAKEDNLDIDKKGIKIYDTIHHEGMHAIGFSHTSGMSYGWSEALKQVIENFYTMGENPVVDVPKYVFESKALGNGKIQLTVYKTSDASEDEVTIELLSGTAVTNKKYSVAQSDNDEPNQVTVTLNDELLTRFFIRVYGTDSDELMSKMIVLSDLTGTTLVASDANSSKEYHAISHKNWEKGAKALNLPLKSNETVPVCKLFLGIDADIAYEVDAKKINSDFRAEIDGADWLESKKLIARRELWYKYLAYDYSNGAYATTWKEYNQLVNDDTLGILCVKPIK